MSPYLVSNKRTELSKIIFKIRSQTLDIKQWQPWKYQNYLCVKCEKYTETMDHFVNCEEYGDKIDINWRDIKQNKKEIQIKIGEFIEKRHRKRQEIIEKQEDGQASDSGSSTPGSPL